MSTPRKSVLITGCSAGGLGCALAEKFHRKGYHVFATARTPSRIPETLADAANVTILTLDVLSAESIAAAAKSVGEKTGGRLDVLVNNSGRVYISPALDTSIEEAKKLFDLHVWAPLAMLQAFAPLLVNAKGCVVNNTSFNGYVPMPLMSAYNSSKAALASASDTWRLELRPLGVRVITLATCGVRSGAWHEYPAVEVPEKSRYFGIREFIRDLGDGRVQDGAITAQQFASHVFRVVEKGTSGTVWAGTSARSARLLSWLAPQWLLDTITESIVPICKEMSKASKERKS